MLGIGLDARCPGARPCQNQACDITQVVPGISQQGQRVDLPAVERLNQNKQHIERNANRKCTIEISRRMVVMPVAMIMIVPMLVRMAVMVVVLVMRMCHFGFRQVGCRAIP